jgi:hypothetical protein
MKGTISGCFFLLFGQTIHSPDLSCPTTQRTHSLTAPQSLPPDFHYLLSHPATSNNVGFIPSLVLLPDLLSSIICSGLQLQLSYTLASGRKPQVQPALLLGPPAIGRSRFCVNQPWGGRGAAHQRWSGRPVPTKNINAPVLLPLAASTRQVKQHNMRLKSTAADLKEARHAIDILEQSLRDVNGGLIRHGDKHTELKAEAMEFEEKLVGLGLRV